MNTSENSTVAKPYSKRIVLAVCVFALICTALAIYGFLIEPNRLVLNRREITVPKWPKNLDGLKIAALSDVHGGSNFIDEEKIRLVVKTTNAQNPDITVLLGDYVSQIGMKGPIAGRNLKMPMAVIARELGGLSAKHGVFAVMGNHDDWYDRAAVRRELEKAGITVLVDELSTIEKAGSKIHLAGLRDLMSLGSAEKFHKDAKSLASRATDGELIILDHNPDIAPYIIGPASISENLRLILAAHTHGGQVWLPLIGSPIVPSSYGQQFAYGHSVQEGVDMFVTTGIGTSILPVRFLVPPEIAILTIRSK